METERDKTYKRVCSVKGGAAGGVERGTYYPCMGEWMVWYQLLDKEVKLLQTIDRLKLHAHKHNRSTKIDSRYL